MEGHGLASQGAKKSRLETMREQLPEIERESFDPPRPYCEAQFIAEYLMEIGPQFASSGLGSATPELELMAWQFNTGRRLPPWQTRLMRKLSGDYIEQLQKSTKADCPPPWKPEDQEAKAEDRQATARRIRDFLRE